MAGQETHRTGTGRKATRRGNTSSETIKPDQVDAITQTKEELSFIKSLLGLMDVHDAHSDLFWRIGPATKDLTNPESKIRFFINCNDEFYWATSDAEEVLPGDLETLAKAYADARAALCEYYGGLLWVARKRNMRPQGPYFQYFTTDALVDHFLAAGPERDPKEAGDYKKYIEKRDAGLRNDPDMAKAEQERNNARRYLKRVTAERQITEDDKRLIQALLGLDHSD